MAYNVKVASIFTQKVGPYCVFLLTECKAWEIAINHHHRPKVVGMWWICKQDSFVDKFLLKLGKFGPINWVEEFNRNQWDLDVNSGEGIKENWVGFIIQHYQPVVTRTHTPNIITKSLKHILQLVNLLFYERLKKRLVVKSRSWSLGSMSHGVLWMEWGCAKMTICPICKV